MIIEWLKPSTLYHYCFEKKLDFLSESYHYVNGRFVCYALKLSIVNCLIWGNPCYPGVQALARARGTRKKTSID